MPIASGTTWVTASLNRAAARADVMNILGHSSLESSSVYTLMMNKELEERYRKFQSHGEPSPA